MGEDLGHWYVDSGRMIRWEPIPRRLTRRERLVTALQRMWQLSLIHISEPTRPD